MNWSTVATAMLPEHMLLAGVVVLMLQAIFGRARAVPMLALAFVLAAALAALWLYAEGVRAAPFAGQFSIDPQAAVAKALILALAAPVMLMAREQFADSTPFGVLMLSSLYGVCLMLSADSFLTLFMGLELMSLPLYALVLLAYRRADGAEAALKYLIMGGAASTTLLMGMSLLFGATGSLALSAFPAALGQFGDTDSATGMLATGGITLFIAALFLKAAVVPFHGWAPDAYEGASVPVTAYMSTLVKAGVLLAAVRLFADSAVPALLVGLIVALPLASIVWGNLAAIRQESFRRMIAYSSIAHAGYLFLAFLGAPAGRFQAVAFYAVTYALANLLAFAALPRLAAEAASDRIDSLRGLYARSPFGALMLGLAMLSLAGIPPLPGFVAKFLVFTNVMAAGHVLVATLGLVASYLGIYFYLRVIQYAFMGASETVAPAVRGPAIAAAVLCLLPVALLMLFPAALLGRLA